MRRTFGLTLLLLAACSVIARTEWANRETAAQTLLPRATLVQLARDALPLPPPPSPPPSLPAGQLTLSIRIELTVNEVSFPDEPFTPIRISASTQGPVPEVGPVTLFAPMAIEPHPSGGCSWETVVVDSSLDIEVAPAYASLSGDPVFPMEIEGTSWHYIVTCPGIDAPTVIRFPAVDIGDRSVPGWLGLIIPSARAREIELPKYTGIVSCLHFQGLMRGANQFGNATVVVEVFTAPCILPPVPP